MTTIKRFDIWIADLNPGKGTVPGKIRPVLILQSDKLNKIGHPSTIVLPFTSDLTKEADILRIKIEPSPANGLQKPSAILTDQIRTLDNLKLIERIGRLENGLYKRIVEAVRVVIEL